MTSSLQVIVLEAVPPLSHSQRLDRAFGVTRWLVIAYPRDVFTRRGAR